MLGTQIPEGPRINVEKAEEEQDQPHEPQPPSPPPSPSPRMKRMSSPTPVITSPTSPPSTTTTDETSGLGTSDASESFHEEGYQSDSSSSEDDDEVPVSFITHSDELYVGGGWSSKQEWEVCCSYSSLPLLVGWFLPSYLVLQISPM